MHSEIKPIGWIWLMFIPKIWMRGNSENNLSQHLAVLRQQHIALAKQWMYFCGETRRKQKRTFHFYWDVILVAGVCFWGNFTFSPFCSATFWPPFLRTCTLAAIHVSPYFFRKLFCKKIGLVCNKQYFLLKSKQQSRLFYLVSNFLDQ